MKLAACSDSTQSACSLRRPANDARSTVSANRGYYSWNRGDHGDHVYRWIVGLLGRWGSRGYMAHRTQARVWCVVCRANKQLEIQSFGCCTANKLLGVQEYCSIKIVCTSRVRAVQSSLGIVVKKCV